MGSARRMAVPGSPKSRKQAHTSATVRDILASREEICCRTFVLQTKLVMGRSDIVTLYQDIGFIQVVPSARSVDLGGVNFDFCVKASCPAHTHDSSQLNLAQELMGLPVSVTISMGN